MVGKAGDEDVIYHSRSGVKKGIRINPLIGSWHPVDISFCILVGTRLSLSIFNRFGQYENDTAYNKASDTK